MQRRKTVVFFGLMLFALFVLVGCGPRAGGGESVRAASPTDVVVDLPAIYVDFNSEGTATIGGMSVSQAGAMIGQSLPDLNVGADTINTMSQYNVQHVQLINTPQGLDILVNGMRVPSLEWDAEVLANMRTTLDTLGVPLGAAGGVLPLLGTLSTGVVVRFPAAEGAAAMPLLDPENAAIAQRAREAIASYEAGVGEALPTIQFVVDYAPDGTWLVEGRGAAEWEEVLPIGWDGFDLEPSVMQAAADAGLKTLGVATDEDGIKISINDSALPTITWGDGEISNVLRLLQQTGVIDQLTGGNPQVSSSLSMVEGLLPAVQTADFRMTVNFPDM